VSSANRMTLGKHARSSCSGQSLALSRVHWPHGTSFSSFMHVQHAAGSDRRGTWRGGGTIKQLAPCTWHNPHDACCQQQLWLMPETAPPLLLAHSSC
jgi:hypothetical protein